MSRNVESVFDGSKGGGAGRCDGKLSMFTSQTDVIAAQLPQHGKCPRQHGLRFGGNHGSATVATPPPIRKPVELNN